MDEHGKKKFLLDAAYTGCRVLLLWAAFQFGGKLLLPFLLGFIVAYLLRPAVRFFVRHSGISVRGGAVVAAVLLYALLAVAVWLAGLFLFAQAQAMAKELPLFYKQAVEPFFTDYAMRLTRWMTRILPHFGGSVEEVFAALGTAMQNAFLSVSDWLIKLVSGIAKGIPTFLLGLLFTIFSSVLISMEYERVSAFVLCQIPKRLHGVIVNARNFLVKTLSKALYAYLLLAAITFAELLAGFWLLGIPRAVTAAVIIALLDLLPILGSGAALIPWGIYLLLAQNYFAGVGMLILWVVLAVVRQIMEPKIVGDRIGQHPLVTVTAMYAGLRLCGFWGLILFPVACLLLVYLQQNGVIRVYKQAEMHK